MASATRIFLRNVLSCVSKEKLFQQPFLSKWLFLQDEHGKLKTIVKNILDDSITKKELIKKIIDYCISEGITNKDIAQLDILCLQNNLTEKMWITYEVIKSEPDSNVLQSPRKLRKQFRKELLSLVKHDLYMEVGGEAIWTWMWMQDGRADKFERRDIVYLVYCPESAYLFASNMKMGHKNKIMKALNNVLGCCAIKERPLTGQCLQSLAQLVLQKSCRGSLSGTKKRKIDLGIADKPMPLKKRRKYVEMSPRNKCIHEENRAELEAKKECVQENFGSEDQPTLERVNFKLETKFRSRSLENVMGDFEQPFRCRVSFAGKSVLEGIRNLSLAEKATWPLPRHLRFLPYLGQNHLTILDKHNSSQTLAATHTSLEVHNP